MNSSFKRQIEFLALPVTICALIITGILILISNLSDSGLFLIAQIPSINYIVDIISLLFGILGFFYVFFLPGIPLLITMENYDLYNSAKLVTIIITYSGIGNYVSVYILMGLGASSFIPIVPFLLIIPALLLSFRFRSSIISETAKSDNNYSLRSNRWVIAAILILVLIALFIRLIVFSSFIVEWSDGLTYHYMIYDVLNNNYMFNELRTNWAPLYPILGALLVSITSSPIVAFKSLSFCFSFLLIAPAIMLVDSLVEEPSMKLKTTLFAIILLLIYPWFNVMAGVNLQDTIAVFFTAASIALLISRKIPVEVSAGAAALAFLSRYSLGIVGPIAFLYLLGIGRSQLKQAIRYAFAWSILVGAWILRNVLVGGVLFSTNDEGRFSLDYFQSGVIRIGGRLVVDNQTLNPGSLWVPLGLLIILMFVTVSKRELLKETLFSRKMILILSVLIVQFIVLSLFQSNQKRFTLTIGYFLPIIWCYLATKLKLKYTNFLVLGWIVWGICFSVYLNYTYWYVIGGRLPVGDVPYRYLIVEATLPSIINIVAASIILCATILVLTCLIALKRHANTMIQNTSDAH